MNLKTAIGVMQSKLSDKTVTLKYGKDLEKLKPLVLKNIQEKYGEPQKIGHEDFEISLESINKLLINFVETAIPDKQTREDFISTIKGENPNVRLNIKTGKNDPINFNVGPQKDGTITLSSSIGEYIGDGKVRTNLANITSHFHEIVHSQSEKFYTGKFIEPKEHMIGEIEAMFMEEVLWGFLNKNSQKIATQLQQEGSTITTSIIKQSTTAHEMEHDESLLKDVSYIASIKSQPGKDAKVYKMRYLLGEIQSRLLYNRLKSEGMVVMDKFVNYLKTNSHLTLDETIKMLNNGKCKDFKDLITDFAQHLENQSNTEIAFDSGSESE